MSEMIGWTNMSVTKDWRQMGAWAMKVTDRVWIVIDITDSQMFDNMFAKFDGEARYYARIRKISLDTIDHAGVSVAVKMCGFKWDHNGIVRMANVQNYIPGINFIGNKVSKEHEETVIVDCCVQYGLGDLLWEDRLENPERLRELAKKNAHMFIRDINCGPSPEDIKSFNEALKKHYRKPMFPLSNIIDDKKHSEHKTKLIN